MQGVESTKQQQMDGDDDGASSGSDRIAKLSYAYDIEEFYGVNCGENSDDEDSLDGLPSFYDSRDKGEIIDLRDESEEGSPKSTGFDWLERDNESVKPLTPPQVDGMELVDSFTMNDVDSQPMNVVDSQPMNVVDCQPMNAVDSQPMYIVDSPQRNMVDSLQQDAVDSPSVSGCGDGLSIEVGVQEGEVEETCKAKNEEMDSNSDQLPTVEKLENSVESCNAKAAAAVDADLMQMDTGNKDGARLAQSDTDSSVELIEDAINIVIALPKIDMDPDYVKVLDFPKKKPYFCFIHKTALNLVQKAIPLIRHVVNKMNEKPKLTAVQSSSSTTSIGSSKHDPNDSPVQYQDDQMGLMKRLLQCRHAPSIQNFSRMLLSSESYPSGELLSFFMQNLVLDTKLEKVARDALKFLNFTLTTHDPRRRYIKKNHIYLQAMTLSNDYKPFTAANTNISVNERTMVWSKAPECSIQWNFFSTVLRTALSNSDDTARSRHNASMLLNHFLGRLVINDNKTLRKLLSWRKHAPIRSTFALNELCRFYIKSLVITLEPKYVTLNKEDESQAGSSEQDDLGFLVAEGKFKKYEDSFEVSHILRQIFIAATDFIHTTDGGENEGLKVIANALANEVKSLSEKRHAVLNRLLNDLQYSSLRHHVACSFFRKTCAPMLSAQGQEPNLDLEDDSGDLYSRVADYLCFIPRVDLRLLKGSDGSNIPRKRRRRSPNRSHDEDGDEFDFDAWLSDTEDKKNALEMVKKQQKRKTNKKNNINRRNNKGETELHRACLHNRPDRVREILLTPGVDPNAPCNVGWTPLAEACSRGHIACVRELLDLPLGTANPGNSDTDILPTLCIDLYACPEDEGHTPLHDAVDNGHHEVARLLLEKGGHDMLFKPNSQGEAPIDMCNSQEQRDLLEQMVHEISLTQQSKNKNHHHQSRGPLSNDGQSPLICELLADKSRYEKVTPSIMSKRAATLWTDACRCYATTVHHLLKSYIDRTQLDRVVCEIVMGKEEDDHDDVNNNDVSNSDDSSLDGIPAKISRVVIGTGGDQSERVVLDRVDSPHVTRAANDVITLLGWNEVEVTFHEHLSRLSDVSKWNHPIKRSLTIFPSEYMEEFLPEALKSFGTQKSLKD